MALTKVTSFTLKDNGGFNCDIHCVYYDQSGQKKGDVPNHDNISLGQSATMDLKAKIPSLQPGDLVQMKVWVQAGKDNTYPTMFEYDPTGENVHFTISGTTLDNSLGMN